MEGVYSCVDFENQSATLATNCRANISLNHGFQISANASIKNLNQKQ